MGILKQGEEETFGYGANTALSIDRDIDPEENVNVLSLTLVTLYLAIAPCSE